MLSRRDLLHRALPAIAASRMMAADAAAQVRFAAISDIQYADQENAGKRLYRESLVKLENIIGQLRNQSPDFVIHLGDLVDRGAENADRIMPLFSRLPRPQYQVLGNHDFFGPRDHVLRRFGMKRPYYEFARPGWRFIVLDGMYVSVKGGWPEESPQYLEGQKMLAELQERRAPNARDWNGAVGAEQRSWLRQTLEAANRRGERAIVCCHFPVLAAATTPAHLLWDHEEVLSVLDAQPAAAAYLCGHDHNGGYAERNGIHHITMKGVVENDVAECVRMVELYSDRIELKRPGAKEGRVLALARRAG